MRINELIKGNQRFQEISFSKYEDKFDDLVKNGQRPTVLYIGCSDSRVVPDLIVDSEPGDMFILRNIGNFVPPYKNDYDFHGSSAAIEYAVSVLKVKDIIVCGHSHCGACASLYEDLEDNDDLVHVRKWLELGEKAKVETLSQFKTFDDKDKILRTTEKTSIKYQLENLLTYPQIKKRVEAGDLYIHGWYYKIEDGSIEYFDVDTNRFENLEKKV